MTDDLLHRLLEQPDFLRKPRLSSLFSDFSPLAITNRDGYDANISAWINALNQVLLQPDSLGYSSLSIVAEKGLAESLTSKQWGKPLALSSVEAEAKARQVWIPRNDFMTREDSIHSVQSFFANPTLGTAVRWGVSKVWSKQTRSLSGQTYVSVPNLEEIARKVTAKMKEESETTFSAHITTKNLLQSFLTERTSLRLSELDFEVLLKFLQRDKSQITVSGETIKFALTGQTESITETDAAVASIKSTMATLEMQIKGLMTTSSEIDATLRGSLYGSKTVALNALRRKKAIEATLTARLENRDTLEAVLTKIDEAALNVGLVQAMAGASGALKRLLAAVGGIDGVDRVLDTVREQMDLSDEVGQAIRQDGAVATVDEDSVEQEYAALLAASEESGTVDSVPVKEVAARKDAAVERNSTESPDVESKIPADTEDKEEAAARKESRQAVPA